MTRADQQTMLSLFTSDGVLSILEPNPISATGHEAITAMTRTLRSGQNFFVQFVHTGLIQLAGQKASARWLIREIASGAGPDGQGKRFYNVFVFAEDDLVKREGRWLISRRTFPYIFVDTEPFTGQSVPLTTEFKFS